jgi:predicted  nucleic acid-binding Zn-ribbon protein
MAISGKFAADFESFYSAVQKAEVSLRSFEQGGEKVSAALTRMGNAFSGQKIIQDATVMTESIRRAGGASILTAKEMASVNATVTEAIAKYKALGGTAPPAMHELAAATQKAETATGGFRASLNNVNGALGALGIGLSVGAVVAFGKELLHMGDEIVRVADRTGLTTDEVQKLSYVAAQSGNSIDELTGAIGQMQNRLSSGDKSAVQSVKELKLSFSELMAASPAQQLEMIATAIAKVPDPADRTRIAMDLFGKTGTAILPTLTSQFAKLADEAPRMSEATVRALDQAGDAFNWLGLQLKVWAADSYTWVGRGFDAIVAAGYRAVAGLYDVAEGITHLAAKIPGATTAFGLLNIDLNKTTQNAQWFRDAANALTRPMETSAAAATTLVKPIKELGEHLPKASKAVATMKEAVEKLLPSQGTWELGIGQLSKRIPDLTRRTEEMTRSFRDLRAEMDRAAPRFQFLEDTLWDAGEATQETSTLLASDLTPALVSVTAKSDALSYSLSGLSNDFVQMAQISGESFSGPLKAIGETVKSVEMVATGLSQIGKAEQDMEAKGFNAQNIAAMAGGWMAVVTAMFQIAEAQQKVQDTRAEERRLEKQAKRLREMFQTFSDFSDDVTASIEHSLAEVDQAFGRFQGFSTTATNTEASNRLRALALNIVAVIQDLGGVGALTADRLDVVIRATGHLFEMIALGGTLGAEATEELDEVLVLLGDHAIESGGLVSKMFLDTVHHADELGIALEGVNELMLGQLRSGAEGLNALLGGMQASATAKAQAQAKALGTMTDKEIDAIVGSFTVTAAQGAGLAASVAADFASMIDRGMSFKDALDALKPSIDILQKALKDSGVDGGESFAFLTELSRIASDAIMGPLVDAIQGANQALKGLHNAGILNQDMFTGIAGSAVDAFNKLIAGGADGNAALMAMGPTLQTIWQLQKDFGYEVDEATQALLDEAEAHHLVGDKHRPVAEQMLLATERIATATEGLAAMVEVLAHMFGVEMPEAVRRGADATQDALDGITMPEFDLPGGSSGGGPDGGGPDYASTGGLVTAEGIQHFRRGGRVLPWRSRGTDTVPAMLTPGEIVATPAQWRAQGNRGGGGQPIVTKVYLDGREIAQALTKVAV